MRKKPHYLFRTLFTRILLDFMLISLLCISFGTVLISAFYSEHQLSDLRRRLLSCADYASGITLVCLDEGNNSDFASTVFHSSMESTAKINAFSIIILNQDQDIFYISPSRADLIEDTAQLKDAPQIATATKKNTVVETGSLNGVFAPNTVYVCYPIIDPSSASVVGTAIIAAPRPGITQQAFLYYLLIISALIILSLGLSFLLAKQISRPLSRISSAARHVASGDYEESVLSDYAIHEISDLIETFNDMVRSLHSIEDSRRSLIASVSHELRTPLTTINGFLDGILDGTIPPEDTKKYLTVCSRETKRLSKLTTELLATSRAESDQSPLSITSIDMVECMLQQLWSYEEIVDQKDIDVELRFESETCYCDGDKDSITRVVINLMDNAFKFVNVGGKVTLSVQCEKGVATVCVENTGEGISPEDLPNIFDKFYKADKSRSLDRSGLGLGLYMARTIIQKHRQKIWAESIPHQYTRFCFTLPCSQKK